MGEVVSLVSSFLELPVVFDSSFCYRVVRGIILSCSQIIGRSWGGKWKGKRGG